MIRSVDKTSLQRKDHVVRSFLFTLLMIISVLPDLSSQNGFYRVHHIPENSTTYEIEEYKGRYYIGTSTFCDGFRECAILSEIDENGNILWSELIPEIDIAFSLSIYDNVIFVSGNNHPQNNRFLVASYNLDGERLKYQEIIPDREFKNMFLLNQTIYNEKLVLVGQAVKEDSVYALLFTLDTDLNKDTFFIPTVTTHISAPLGHLVIMLQSSNQGVGNHNRIILQYDKDFNLVWRYETEKTTGDRVRPVGCELPDGRLIMACRHEGTDYIASVCCINKDSTLSWRFDHPLHGSRGRRIYRIKPLPNGDIIGCGHYTELQFSEHRLSTTPFLFKISAEGNLLWERV
jgi:hypothetical protein